jgi:hypothetical protein
MSAVASAEFVPASPVLEVVAGLSDGQLAEQEMYRWMLWMGLPTLATALFVSAIFATDTIWYIGGAIAGVITTVGVLIWLAMTSCTNSN